MKNSQAKTIDVRLSNGSTIKVETSYLGEPEETGRIGEESEYEDEEAALSLPSFQAVRDTIRGVADDIAGTFEDIDVKPTKTAVEFGIELESDRTSLTAKLVPLSGKVNMKIMLEWSSEA